MDTNNLENKKSNTLVIVILILIILGVIALVCYLFFSKKEMKKNNQSDISVEKVSIKLDNTKDYVYDATYKYNNKYTEYSFDEAKNKVVVNNEVTAKDKIETHNDSTLSYKYNSTVQHLEDLKVPYININSDDAKKVNQELEKLYISYAKKFDNNAEQKDEDGEYYGPDVMCTQVLTYKNFTSNNILSIVTIDYGVCTSQPIQQYHTYNFDLTTGKLLSYKDIYTKVGIKENEMENKVEQAIINKQKEIMKNDDYFETNFETFKNESITNYKNSIYNNTNKYYLDKDNKLNIITTFSVPAGSGEYDYNIKIN